MKSGINLWKCSRIACQISRGTRAGINLQRIKSVCFHSSVARCQTENIGMRLAYFDKNFRLFLGLAAAAGTAVRAFDFGTTTPSRPKEKEKQKMMNTSSTREKINRISVRTKALPLFQILADAWTTPLRRRCQFVAFKREENDFSSNHKQRTANKKKMNPFQRCHLNFIHQN